MRFRAATIIFIFLVTACGGQESATVLIQKAGEGDEKASWRLVQAMGSSDREAALEAYKGVVGLGGDMEPWLRKGLESSEDAVVEASAASLGNIGSVVSIPALIDVLKGSGSRRYAAAWALGEIGDLSVVPELVHSLGSADGLVRKSAVRALVKLGPEAGAPVTVFLRKAMDPESQRAAIRVVGELRTGSAVAALTSIQGQNRDAAAWALGRIGVEGALEPLLEALLDERWQVRREAAQALGSLEDDRAARPLEDALDDSTTVVREWAARSLETITGRKVLYRSEDGEMVPPYNLYR